MSSVFFQISGTDFIEATKTYGALNKEFGLRIVSIQGSQIFYVYLPPVNLNELSILASIFQVRILQNIRNINELVNYLTGIYRTTYILT